MKNIACILHIGDLDIFYKMKTYINNIKLGHGIYYRVKFFITIYKNEYLTNIKQYFKDFTSQNYKIIVIKNKGMDIGGFFKILQYWDSSKLRIFTISEIRKFMPSVRFAIYTIWEVL